MKLALDRTSEALVSDRTRLQYEGVYLPRALRMHYHESGIGGGCGEVNFGWYCNFSGDGKISIWPRVNEGRA